MLSRPMETSAVASLISLQGDSSTHIHHLDHICVATTRHSSEKEGHSKGACVCPLSCCTLLLNSAFAVSQSSLDDESSTSTSIEHAGVVALYQFRLWISQPSYAIGSYASMQQRAKICLNTDYYLSLLNSPASGQSMERKNE